MQIEIEVRARPRPAECLISLLVVPVDFTSIDAKIPYTKSARIATSQSELRTTGLDLGYT